MRKRRWGVPRRASPTRPSATSTAPLAMSPTERSSVLPATESASTYGTQLVVPRMASKSVAAKVVVDALSM